MSDHENRPASIGEVWTVMREVGRARFLPPEQRPFAGADMPLPIGHGQTNSQPSTVAAMLELLEVVRGARVLDVGSGSGWTTAILARLVGETGRVIGVERIPELTRGARTAVASLEVSWAEVRQAAPDVLGVPEEAPYDRILVSAEATSMPVDLVDQLAPGGVLVVPVRSVMYRVRRSADGQLHTTRHGLYSFVPLVR